MLVLTRKLGESIQIGNSTVTVIRIGQSTVKLAVEAPRDVDIARAELLERIVSQATAPEQQEA